MTTLLDQLRQRRDTHRQGAEQILTRAADEQRDLTPDELADHRHGANGANITNYDWLLDAQGVVLGNNYEPNAHIVGPRTVTSLAKLKEATTNAYLAPPASLLPRLPTKQIPINLTTGTSTDTSEIYTAQWDQLMIGIRTSFSLQFLRERFLADNLQYAFLAYLRADVQLAQPAAFTVDTGVRA